MEYWYEFRAYNTAPQYGYGPSSAADDYTDHLNRGRDINHFAAYRLPDEQAVEMGLEGRSDTFDILTALDDAAEAGQ